MSIERFTLGAAQLGFPYGIANRSGGLSARESEALLKTAIELGVRSIDTAPAYGVSEFRIGGFLRGHGRPDGLRICTKLPECGDIDPGDLATFVERSVEGSRNRLGIDRLDFYLIHAAADLQRHGERLIEALASQRAAGRIERIGISIYEPDEAELALAHSEITAVQHPLNLLDRRMIDSGRLADLVSGGVTTFARSPMLQGLLGLAPGELPDPIAYARPVLERLNQLLAEWDTTPTRAALPFVAATDGVENVVVGVETSEQLTSGVASLARPLPRGLAEALTERLDDVPIDVLDPRRWPPAA